MDLYEFKKEYVKQELKITEDYGRVHSFIDFGNVNYWFDDDRQDENNVMLAEDKRLSIDLEKLKDFIKLFSLDRRFYYGHDAQNYSSLGFIRVARDKFGKHRVITKQMQKIRHHLSNIEMSLNTRTTHLDNNGTYIHIPKCNFDVEITVDAIKTMDNYDSFCLLSSDADFVHLIRYLKGKDKKIILIKGGHIVHQLMDISDIVISAQDIKKYISVIKQKPGIEPGLADRKPVSTGRTTTEDRTGTIAKSNIKINTVDKV